MNFTALRAKYETRMTLPTPPAFQSATEGFLSKDSRNFQVVVTQAELDKSDVLQGEHYGPGGSTLLLVFADYNPPLTTTVKNISGNTDLVVYIADAYTGRVYGSGAILPGCHD